MSVWRFFGLTTYRSKPFDARLDAARDIALFVVLPLAVVYGVYALVAWRHQKNHQHGA